MNLRSSNPVTTKFAFGCLFELVYSLRFLVDLVSGWSIVNVLTAGAFFKHFEAFAWYSTTLPFIDATLPLNTMLLL
jgi:hypothetical protein